MHSRGSLFVVVVRNGVFDQRYPASEVIALQKTRELLKSPPTWLFSLGSIEAGKVGIRLEANTMKLWILILTPTLLMFSAPDLRAHNLVTASGNAQAHQHVYRRQEYGKPLQQGHQVQSGGASGMVIWGSDTRPAYGKSTVRRNGPIIGDQNYRRDRKPHLSNKYGSGVNSYGKAVNGYGKAVIGYARPASNR